MPFPLFLIFWDNVQGQSNPQDDLSNYPLFQSKEKIDPEVPNGCGSAALNCLTQASHGKKFAFVQGPMVYNNQALTAGAAAAGEGIGRAVAAIFTFGLSEIGVRAAYDASLSSMWPILDRVSAYSITTSHKMAFLKTTLQEGNPCLILYDKGEYGFHWVCCCGYLDILGNVYYYINNWGKLNIVSETVVDQRTSGGLDHFVAVKSKYWRLCRYKDATISVFGLNLLPNSERSKFQPGKAKGFQTDGAGEHKCCVVKTSHGRIPGKFKDGTAWYPYGGYEHATDDRSSIKVLHDGYLLPMGEAAGYPSHGYQNDGAGEQWCAIAHTKWGTIPGKARAGECWFSYGGREYTTRHFQYVRNT